MFDLRSKHSTAHERLPKRYPFKSQVNHINSHKARINVHVIIMSITDILIHLIDSIVTHPVELPHEILSAVRSLVASNFSGLCVSSSRVSQNNVHRGKLCSKLTSRLFMWAALTAQRFLYLAGYHFPFAGWSLRIHMEGHQSQWRLSNRN